MRQLLFEPWPVQRTSGKAESHQWLHYFVLLRQMVGGAECKVCCMFCEANTPNYFFLSDPLMKERQSYRGSTKTWLWHMHSYALCMPSVARQCTGYLMLVNEWYAVWGWSFCGWSRHCRKLSQPNQKVCFGWFARGRDQLRQLSQLVCERSQQLRNQPQMASKVRFDHKTLKLVPRNQP